MPTAVQAWIHGGVTVNLGLTTAQKIGGGGTDTILNFENVNGAAGDNNLTGSAGDNVINGNAGVDKLNGMGGNDTLSGGYSADTLNGGDGNDILSGGAGFVSYNKVLSGSGDVLTGGNGADTFVMDLQTNRVRMVINAGTDTITDFKSSEGDHINARGATFVGSSAFSHVLGHAEVQVTGSAAAQTVNLDFNGDGVTDSAFTVLNTMRSRQQTSLSDPQVREVGQTSASQQWLFKAQQPFPSAHSHPPPARCAMNLLHLSHACSCRDYWRLHRERPIAPDCTIPGGRAHLPW
jgi:Ca2+-binding RTX toxin-like protein